MLRVEKNASGAWSMYRDCRECVATLRSGDKQAALRTVEGAQAITDVYMRDKVGRANEEGLRWAVMWARLALIHR